MKKLIRFAVLFVIAFALTVITGCTTTSSVGQKVSAEKATEIQKGKTTRAEIEHMFGPPMTASILGDGRRLLIYVHAENTTKRSGLAFVPVVGMFAGRGSAEVGQQTMQVIVDQNNIVQDFELSEYKTGVQSSGGFLNTKTTPVETAAVPPEK